MGDLYLTEPVGLVRSLRLISCDPELLYAWQNGKITQVNALLEGGFCRPPLQRMPKMVQSLSNACIKLYQSQIRDRTFIRYD